LIILAIKVTLGSCYQSVRSYFPNFITSDLVSLLTTNRLARFSVFYNLLIADDENTADQLRELMAKGALSGLVFIADDVRALYDALRERGVTDFTQEPTEHFYGVDMGLRDPFGNHIRVLQQGT